MIADLLFGLGMVAVFEGLVLALVPGHLRSVLETIDRLGPDRARQLGLIALGLGVALVWLARA